METCRFIHLKRNGGDGTSFPLTSGSTLVLGSDPECDFRLQVSSVSNKHAKLIVDESGKVHVSSLVPNTPVKLDNIEVVEENTPIPNKQVMTIGSCSFRFEYLNKSVSPLQETNTKSPSKVLSKSPRTPRTPKQSGKENDTSVMASVEKEIKVTPKSASKVTPALSKSSGPQYRSPVTSAKKKAASNKALVLSLAATPATASEKVPTPIPPQRSFSRSSSQSSRKSSLASIQESDESVATPISLRRSFNTSNTSLLLKTTPDTTTKEKRRSKMRKDRKSVTFGPMLSPELIDSRLPPRTPIKAGCSANGNRRSLSTSILLSDTITEEEEETSECEEDYEYSMTGFEDSFVSADEEESLVEEDTMSSNDEDSSVEEENESAVYASPRRRLATPVKIELQGRRPLRSLPTPVRQSIRVHPLLRKTKRAMATPLRRQIQGSSRQGLRNTKPSMPTPIKVAILGQPTLRKTKKSMPTPVRSAIQERPALRKTKKSMPTPVRSAIQERPALRKTMKSMPTPVRSAIQERLALRKTKKSMPTPLRKGIESKPTLRKTLKSLATPIRREIESKPSLRATRQSMPSPLMAEIMSKHALRVSTKRAMPTPVRASIKSHPVLRKTKRTMPTPVRAEIQGRPNLHKTKQAMPTPVRAEIQGRPNLRRTKHSLATPLKLAIEAKYVLRKTKRSLPTPVKEAIKQRPSLRATKRSIPTPLMAEIEGRLMLRVTKRKLPTPLRAQIRSGISLNGDKKGLARAEIQSKPKFHHVPVKRGIDDTATGCDSPLPLPPCKRRRMTAVTSPSPFNFKPFMKHAVDASPKLSGVKDIFASPKTNFSMDPSDNFEAGLFGGVVRFASPLAFSAKKPTGPSRSEPMPSRLKNKGERLPTAAAKRQGTRRNKTAASAAPRRVTRSTRAPANDQSVADEEAPVLTLTHSRQVTRRSKRCNAAEETDVLTVVPIIPIDAPRPTRKSKKGNDKKEVSVPEPCTNEEAPVATRKSKKNPKESSVPTADEPPMATRKSKKAAFVSAPTTDETAMATRKSKKEAVPPTTDETVTATRKSKKEVAPTTDETATATRKSKKEVAPTTDETVTATRKSKKEVASTTDETVTATRKSKKEVAPTTDETVTATRKSKKEVAPTTDETAMATRKSKKNVKEAFVSAPTSDETPIALRRRKRLREPDTAVASSAKKSRAQNTEASSSRASRSRGEKAPEESTVGNGKDTSGKKRDTNVVEPVRRSSRLLRK